MAYAFSLALEMSSMLNRASDCAAVVLKEVQAGVAVCAFALDVEKKRGGTSDCLNNILEWTEDSIGSGLIDQTTIPKRSACDDKSDYLKAQLMKEDYPIGLKRELYRAPRLTADDDFHQPSDWEVSGVGAKR